MDANQPTDQALVSSWPAWVRESRAAINSVVAAGGFGVTNLAIAGGSVSLSVGTGLDLQNVGYEIVIVTGVGASTLVMLNVNYQRN